MNNPIRVYNERLQNQYPSSDDVGLGKPVIQKPVQRNSATFIVARAVLTCVYKMSFLRSRSGIWKNILPRRATSREVAGALVG